MYFTSGGDRAFESLMQGKPGFDHYDSGDAGAPEDCGDCRFYRPDWKYQFCVYAECPYQPGKLTALDAVLFQVKGVDDEMAVFRVEKNRGYTVMSNHHLRNKDLSLKAKGLLSQMLSLPENWDYTLKGLSLINRESIDAIRTAVWELRFSFPHQLIHGSHNSVNNRHYTIDLIISNNQGWCNDNQTIVSICRITQLSKIVKNFG